MQLKWVERIDGPATIRTADYLGYTLEVTAVPCGDVFAATVRRTVVGGSTERDTDPHWGDTAAQALDNACRAARRQAYADSIA